MDIIVFPLSGFWLCFLVLIRILLCVKRKLDMGREIAKSYTTQLRSQLHIDDATLAKPCLCCVIGVEAFSSLFIELHQLPIKLDDVYSDSWWYLYSRHSSSGTSVSLSWKVLSELSCNIISGWMLYNSLPNSSVRYLEITVVTGTHEEDDFSTQYKP